MNRQVGLIVQYAACIARHYPWYARGWRVAVNDNGNQGVDPREYEKKSYEYEWNADQKRAARLDARPPTPPWEGGIVGIDLLSCLSSVVEHPLAPLLCDILKHNSGVQVGARHIA